MQVSLGHHDWRVLRAVLRNKGRPALGRSLRLDMTRRTQDGSFLTNLVRNGLLKVFSEGQTPFESAFILTDLGTHAAEYGVYDVDWETLKALTNGDDGKKPAAKRR